MAALELSTFTERVKHLLRYSPETGELRWNVNRRGSAVADSVAGTVDQTGYLRVKIDGKRYKAHRIAWLIQFGQYPSEVIDHINGVPTDNRLSNLRDVSAKLNSQNLKRAKKNKMRTDVLGPTFQTARGKWLVKVKVDGKAHYIGRYDNLEEATEAYKSAKRQYHPGYVD